MAIKPKCHLYKEKEGIPFDIYTQTIIPNCANCERWLGDKCSKEKEI
jgi:hypothetical protein